MNYSEKQMDMFDIIVVGGGPGGYEAAELAGKYGLKVALIERNQLGGTCLNKGCIPLKGYLYLANMIYMAKELQNDNIFIDSTSTFHINQSNVIKRNKLIVSNLRKGIIAKLENMGVTIFEGNASILCVNEEQITITVNELELISKNLIIATGAREIRLPITDVNLEYQIIYSNEILELKTIPQKMVIVGAGAIGLETADYFNAVGCEVTVIDTAAEIGSGLDIDIAIAYKKILERKGIHIYTEAKVKAFGKKEILVEKAGGDISLKAEYVLISVGRRPFIEGMNLEKCGINYDVNGIIIDDICRTNKHNVFACGDVTGKTMLAHAAYEQARVIIDNLVGRVSFIDYFLIPQIIYTSPEVMSIGLSEKKCIMNNIQYIAKELPLTYSGKYFVEHKKDGAIAKIIVNSLTKTIIGFSMIGNGASEIALSVELLMANKTKIEDIEKIIFPHPTVGEILRQLADSII